jgi:hypothetical protein
MDNDDGKYGYTWRFGFQRVAKSNPFPNHSRRTTVLLCLLALLAVGLAWVAFPAHSSPAAVNTAHVQPAPAGPAPIQVHVTGTAGAICIMPTGKAKGPVELVKVP